MGTLPPNANQEPAMTNYDEWKTTETFSDEAEFVAKRKGELVKEWMGDKAKVTEAIADALSDDGEDFFAGLMAKLFVCIATTNDERKIADAGGHAFSSLYKPVYDRIKREAETTAQLDWDNRLTGPEGDL